MLISLGNNIINELTPSNPKLLPFLNWVFLNLVLPLAPMGMKLFINVFGPKGEVDLKTIWTINDLLVYSLMINIINLNINIDGPKTFLEKLCRRTMSIFIALNCMLLAIDYLHMRLNYMDLFFWLAIGFPIVVGMFYQFKYQPANE